MERKNYGLRMAFMAIELLDSKRDYSIENATNAFLAAAMICQKEVPDLFYYEGSDRLFSVEKAFEFFMKSKFLRLNTDDAVSIIFKVKGRAPFTHEELSRTLLYLHIYNPNFLSAYTIYQRFEVVYGLMTKNPEYLQKIINA